MQIILKSHSEGLLTQFSGYYVQLKNFLGPD